MDLKIEKGIPIPNQGHRGLTGVLRQMEIGDSVLIPLSAKAGIHTAAKQAGVKVLMRRTEQGPRVWRVL